MNKWAKALAVWSAFLLMLLFVLQCGFTVEAVGYGLSAIIIVGTTVFLLAKALL